MRDAWRILVLPAIAIAAGCGTPIAVTPVAGPAPTQATEAAIVDTNGISALVRDLGHKDFKVREAADRQLRLLPESADAALRMHFDDPDPEIAERVRKIVSERGKPVILTREMLEQILIPEISFTKARLVDVVGFFNDILSHALNPEPRGAQTTKKRAEIVLDLQRMEPRVITWSAKYISLMEALKITAEVSGMRLRIEGNKVILTPPVECD